MGNAIEAMASVSIAAHQVAALPILAQAIAYIDMITINPRLMTKK